MAPISYRNFAQLDVCLIGNAWRHIVTDTRSYRRVPLNSHHFFVISQFAISTPKTEARTKPHVFDLQCLRNLDNAMQFGQEVNHWMEQLLNSQLIDCNDVCSVEELYEMHSITLQVQF